MIIMFNYSDLYKNICIVDGQIKILKFNNYNGEYNQGIADVTKDGTILGLFTQNDKAYLVKNNIILDLSGKKINCENVRINETRKFKLTINDEEFYSLDYDVFCSEEELIYGEDETEQDFLLSLSNILSSKESLNNFIKGYTLEKDKSK